MKISYLELQFDVKLEGAGNVYGDGSQSKLVFKGPIALFSSYSLTSSNGKELEDFENAHIACVMYKSIESSKDSDDLSIGFHRNIETRKRKELKEIIE